MRRVLVLAVLAAALAQIPATASAEAWPACRVGDGPSEYQDRLNPFMHDAEAAARRLLGPQFVMLWLDTRRQGWDVGVAPGALSIDQARDALVADLRSRLSAADADVLIGALHVEPQPYGEADLRAAQDAIFTALRAAVPEALFVAGATCQHSDAIRVEVELWRDSARTPELIERVRAVLAPFGDRALLVVSDAGPPVVNSGVATPHAFNLRDLLAMPPSRRCVSGSVVHLRVRAEARRRIALVTVSDGRRRQSRGPARSDVPIAVPFAHRRTTLAIAVQLTDGRRDTRTVTYRRCSAA